MSLTLDDRERNAIRCLSTLMGANYKWVASSLSMTERYAIAVLTRLRRKGLASKPTRTADWRLTAEGREVAERIRRSYIL